MSRQPWDRTSGMSAATREVLELRLRRRLGLSLAAADHDGTPHPGRGPGPQASAVDIAARYLYDILRLDEGRRPCGRANRPTADGDRPLPAGLRAGLTSPDATGSTTFPTRKRSVSRRD
ncbi:hypothetical protein AB0C70_05370 [Streptomyces sp. NPDC048564]|uniref:hypothetical protein n=1 Tax=unclassified Streptomyces TaxID=2593676 RepID=UPI00342DC7F9